MTVTSTNYSSLDEVWGDSFQPSGKTKKEKKKKVIDPICELYEMGNNNGYSENDLISYANSFIEQHDSAAAKMSKNGGMDTQQRLSRSDYDVRPQRDVVEEPVERYQDTADETEYMAPPPKPTPRAPVRMTRPVKETYYREIDDDEEPVSRFAFIDLLLYIVSGIILIFVMEQFVKIGLLLQ